MKYFHLVFFLCLLTGGKLSGQSEVEKLQVFLIFSEEDTLVRIRWAPANMQSWYWGIENGYHLSRYTIATNGVRDSLAGQIASKIVLDSLIKPLPENQWSNVNATQDQIDVAKGTIYEESFIVDSMIGESEIARAFADHSDRESRFIYGLFAADQKFEIAEAMGFAYLDENVNPNSVYYYRVEFLGNADSSLLIRSGIEVDLEDDIIIPSPGPLLVDQAVDTNVLIVWDVTHLEGYYGSYNIERSTDSINFTKINSLPLVASGNEGVNTSTVYFSDDVPSIGTWYYYRVKGVTPFGIEGPPSDTLKLKTSISPKASAPIISNLELGSEEVVVDWEFPSNENTLISEFRVYRSSSALGPFLLIDSVGPTIRTWSDENPISSGYYRIAAHDLADVEVRAGDKLIQLEDTIPPLVPEGLACSIDDAGNVTVSWNSVIDPALKGYRIFSGNSEDGTFGEETNEVVRDTSFSFETSLNTLTSGLYIKVQSIDERENYSEYSDICLALRPDQIPPSNPVLLRANPLQIGIQLEWLHSASEDLHSHLIQRKKAEEALWVDLLTVDSEGAVEGTPVGIDDVNTTINGGTLMDTSAIYPYEYQYRVLAVDVSNNKSNSEILTVLPYDSGERGNIIDLEGDTLFESGIYHVRLTWDYNMLQGLYDFQIYRSADGKPMRAYSTTNGRGGVNFAEVAESGGVYQIEPGSFQWVDPELGTARIMSQSGYDSPEVTPSGVERIFKYKVMARHFDGGWSPVSDEVEVGVYVPGL